MESSSSSKQHEGAKPAVRTHWRRRDPSATAVYVVHPTQFRDVVQQLTGAPASPAMAARAARDQGDSSGNGGGAGTSTAAGSNAAAQRPREGGASRGEEESRQRTLGQMHQECMAWANSDDY